MGEYEHNSFFSRAGVRRGETGGNISSSAHASVREKGEDDNKLLEQFCQLQISINLTLKRKCKKNIE